MAGMTDLQTHTGLFLQRWGFKNPEMFLSEYTAASVIGQCYWSFPSYS